MFTAFHYHHRPDVFDRRKRRVSRWRTPESVQEDQEQAPRNRIGSVELFLIRQRALSSDDVTVGS